MRSLPPAGDKKPFYGWIIVVVLASANAMAMALATLNMGLFIKPMGDELGISRAEFGWAGSVRQIAGAVTSPWLGRLIDRYGVRWLLAATSLLGGVAVMALAWVTAGWQLIALLGFLGFIGLLGANQITTTVPVLKWFVAKRAPAVAVLSMGAPVGAVLFLPLSQFFIDGYGWRGAWILLGLISVIVMVPLSVIFVRRQPEDMGLLPDGVPALGMEGGAYAEAPVEEYSFTLHQAVRHRVFWQLALVFSVVMFAMSTMALHRLPAFVERGIEPTWVAWSTAFDATLASISTLLMGTLGARVPVRYLGGAGLLLMGLSALVLVVGQSVAAMFLSMGLFGFGIGGLLYMQNIIWADYFGRAHIGAIRGVVNPITMLTGAAGAPIAGYVYDATGSYEPVWWASVGLMLVGACAVLVTAPPREQTLG